jgi:hypothetical protein
VFIFKDVQHCSETDSDIINLSMVTFREISLKFCDVKGDSWYQTLLYNEFYGRFEISLLDPAVIS